MTPETINPEDADAAYLDQPGNRRGGAHDDRCTLSPQLALVVGDEAGTGVNQSQRQIGFSGSRSAAQEHGTGAACRGDRHRSGVDEERPAHDSAGRRIRKRAPQTAPVASVRFSAQTRPRCASTICFEIDSPRPEWVPNFSPAGRSV